MKYCALIFFFYSVSFAESKIPEVKLGAEADVFFELANKPSSVKGQSQFDFALLQLSPEFKIDENLSLHFRFVLAEERSSQEKNYLSELQNAFIQYKDY